MILQINRNICFHLEQNRHCAPEGCHDELAQHETEKERGSLPKTTDPTMSCDNPLQQETHKNGEPEEIHCEGAGDGIACRMEG